MDDTSELFSIYSSSTQTTIQPGLGYLSGKAIHRLGEVVLNGVDNVIVNRQLGRIETSVKTDNAWREDTPSSVIKQMCGILLELSHPGYPFSIRARALRIIMTLIGSMAFIGLATTLVDLNSTSQLHRHLCDVLDCLWDSKSENAFRREAGDEATRNKLSALRAAGHESYVAAFPGQAHPSKPLLSSPFILYLTLIAVLGDSHHTRLILSEELDVVRFLLSIGLSDKVEGGTGIMAGRLLMEVHRLRLDPVADDGLKSVVENAISELSSSLEAGDPLIEHMWAQFERGSADPPSQVFLMNAVIVFRRRLTKNGTDVWPDLSGDGLILRDVKVLLIGGGCGGKVPQSSLTTIMKQLILAHHGPTPFAALYDTENYLEMMERQLMAFLGAAMITKFPGDDFNPLWARYNIHTIESDFDKLTPPGKSSSKSSSERLLELHAFIHKNITSVGDLRSFMASVYTVLYMDTLRLEALSDDFEILFEALRGMVDRFHNHAIADRPASLMPTYQDLGWYIRTTGVHRESFTTQDNLYTFWDCGGQRTERKKWIGYYPLTDVVLFVVSLNGYDRVVLEDDPVNGMDESLAIFKSICTSQRTLEKQLKTCPLILVFNQMDLLAEKLERSPLQNYFPDYDGGSDTDAACEYIKNKFLEHVSLEQNVHVHFMSALDPKDVNALFAKVQQEYIIHKFTTQGTRRSSRTSIVMASG
ncbi:hypothetical protein AAF712_012275 [Marasmius tenuissimus]|uniref:Uncharacterized protein n=1 Tax=Marasmius tenuissimus TaxID=585030 RepID=A0ABR2ZHV5_9AGAR